MQEFLKEQTQRKEEFEKLHVAEANFDTKSAGMETFQENWNLSQFWYNEKTANLLADELLDGADETTRIVVISAPSVYAAIKKRDELPTREIYLLEYDDRFKLLGGSKFFHYDFVRPLDLPKELQGTFDRVLIDPPFLSEDCQTKASLTARWLLNKEKTAVSKKNVLQYRTIICTGERMGTLIKKIYPDTRVTNFYPEHAKGLSNEFRCYASYEGPNWEFEST